MLLVVFFILLIYFRNYEFANAALSTIYLIVFNCIQYNTPRRFCQDFERLGEYFGRFGHRKRGACKHRRWRIQRAGVGASVEKIEKKRQPEDFFGHRKRGCEATSSPSAPATGKALKPLGFRAFSLRFRGRRTSVLPHFDAQKRGEFRIRRHPVTTVPSAPSSKQHQNFSSGCVPAGAFLCFLRCRFLRKLKRRI